jgi:hypothetical protein
MSQESKYDVACYHSSRLRGVDRTRRDEILPSVGILREGFPVPAFTSPIRPKKEVMTLW